MSNINGGYAKDLDLNLLRVFAVVAEEGSITRAAARLYVTQPAVSASMRRLASFVGAELLTRQGRGLVLTHRGVDLLAATREHLGPLVSAVTATPEFDAKASTATFHLGLGDGIDALVVSPLLAALRSAAPRMQLVVSPVQFHSVEEQLLGDKIALAVAVADPLPRSIVREPLVVPMRGVHDFVCLYDPRHVKLPTRLTEREYFALEHVVVSYAGDMRGIVEDTTGRQRKVRISVPGFSLVAEIVDGSPIVATLPLTLAEHIQERHPRLRTAAIPFWFDSPTLDLLWSRVRDGDQVVQFMRGVLGSVVRKRAEARSPRKRTRSP